MPNGVAEGLLIGMVYTRVRNQFVHFMPIACVKILKRSALIQALSQDYSLETFFPVFVHLRPLVRRNDVDAMRHQAASLWILYSLFV